VQQLGGSIARQPAQAGQWKYSIAQTLCSVYEWGLAKGKEGDWLFGFSRSFESSLGQEFKLLSGL